MAKQRSVFVCQQCGNENPKWMGKCPSCGEWNSLVETVVSTRMSPDRKTNELGLRPQKLSEIKSVKRVRFKTKISELDRVLGGGIVPGSVVLVAGQPGIGKSTLMLQLAATISAHLTKNQCPSVLYVSGEESLQQLKIRAERLTVKSSQLFLLAETSIDQIIAAIRQQFLPKEQSVAISSGRNLVVVDSVQTLSSQSLSGMSGSVGQVRECTGRLVKVAKSFQIPVFLIGHVTKAGTIAGPKVLEHMVDTVLYLEGERFSTARLLRATKNRFGASDEVGVFEMTDKGMQAVSNPSKLFLKERVKRVPGSVVVATMEGTRPVLAEIQALVVPSQLAVPRRVGQGIDYNRLQLIVAVLTKKLGFPLGSHDVFVNVTGGLRIKEPAVDLGMALAIISSFKNKTLDSRLACFGEIGLLGELREVGYPEKREKEARRLGFETVISPTKKPISISQVTKKLFTK